MKESTNLKDHVAIVANNLNATDKNYAFFKSGIELIKVHFSEIVYLQSEHVYVHMITTTGKVLLRAQLKEVGNFLPSNKFQRIHQRYVVNIDHVDKVKIYSLIMGETELPLTKEYRNSLLEHFNIFS